MLKQFLEFFPHVKQKNDTFLLEIDHTKLDAFIANLYGFDILLDISAVDYEDDGLKIVYIFKHTNLINTLVLSAFLPHKRVKSIESKFSVASWLEREVFDQYGVVFLEHSNLKRVLNHHQFVGHPLLKSYNITDGQVCTKSDSLEDEIYKELEKTSFSKDELMFLNLGPSHPASHGTIRTLVALDGEDIVAAVSEIGYLHRGFEKSCENHTYSAIIPYTDRLNYCSSMMNNIAYVKTIEEMLDIKITPRAMKIRVMLMELSRIMDHLVCLAALLVDMGALTNYWYLYNPREAIYNFLSKLTGSRLTVSFMRIGGMSNDLHDTWLEDLNEALKQVQEGTSNALSLIKDNKIFSDRTMDIGVVSKEDALNMGLSGVNLRASGVAHDIRKDNPYYGYDELDFDIVVGEHGDVYDRVMARFMEIDESIKIINQVKDNIPKGDVNITNHKVVLPPKQNVYNTIEGVMNHFKLTFDGVQVPKGEYYSSIEAVNGELGFYVVSDGSGTPYKLKVKAPSFTNMSAYPKMIISHQIADAILILGSLNIIAGEMDR